MDQNSHLIIRKESVPRSWSELDASQKDAFSKLLAMIELYLKYANKSIKKTQDYPALRFNYDSNILFLDGDRGTGKSTVLFSLLYASIDKDNQFFNSLEEKDKNDLYHKVHTTLSTLKTNSLIWLDPLDLELLPDPANLYAALMVRIEEVFKREGLNKDDGLFPFESALFPSQSEHPWNTFSQLMRSVSIAWSTNLESRKSSDPDTYSEEVLKTERSRLKLKNFDLALQGLADVLAKKSGGQKPLFILPVDDADLNPLRALDIFQLIRMISSPHILFLVAGRYENLDKLFKLKYASDFSKQLPNSWLSDEHQDFIRDLSTNTAYAALKKLIPKGNQFVNLTGLKYEESLSYPYMNEKKKDKSDPKSISELLKLIKLNSDYVKPYDTLYQFIVSLDPGAKSNSISQIAEIFSGPIRAIDDLWKELIEIEKKPDQLADFVKKAYIGTLESEPALPNWVIEILIDQIQNFNIQNKIQFQSEFIDIVATNLPYPIENTVTSNSHPYYVFGGIHDFNAIIKHPDKQKKTFHLEKWRTAWLLFIHDILLITENSSIPRFKLKNSSQELSKSSIINRKNMLLNWPSLDWFLFHHLELFKYHWNKTILTGNSAKWEKQQTLDYQAYVWISLLTQIVIGEKPEIEYVKKTDLDQYSKIVELWNKNIFDKLQKFNINDSPEFRVQYFFDLIISILVICSPERGLTFKLSENSLLKLKNIIEDKDKNSTNFFYSSQDGIFLEVCNKRAEYLVYFNKINKSTDDGYLNIWEKFYNTSLLSKSEIYHPRFFGHPFETAGANPALNFSKVLESARIMLMDKELQEAFE